MNYIVSGAGTAAVNGTYTAQGLDSNGHPYWASDTHLLVRNSASSEADDYWYLCGPSGLVDILYYGFGTMTAPPLTGWVADPGTPPAPTLAESSGSSTTRKMRPKIIWHN